MRTRIFCVASVATFCLSVTVACTQELHPESSGKEMVFTAIHADDYGSGQTRTVIGGNGSLFWSPADEISIFQGTGSDGGNKFVSQNDVPAKTVDFKGFLEGLGGLSQGQDFWAIYPYCSTNSCDGQSVSSILPPEQVAAAGSFGLGCYPAIAHSNTTELAFYAVAGGVQFSVSSPGIKSVRIMGNDGEKLAGTYKASVGPDGKPLIDVSNSVREVTLTAPAGTSFLPGESYVISLLPTELNRGITITLITDDNRVGSVISYKPQTIKRAVIGRIGVIDEKVSSWKEIPSETEIGETFEAVDLGLSVKWATFNIGATSPDEVGYLFAWGETLPKSKYWPDNYKFRESGEWYKAILSKYNTLSKHGTVDNKTLLELEDDAANSMLGGAWRMPSYSEWSELMNKCRWEWTEVNNWQGNKVTSLINGNSIFIPSSEKDISNGQRSGTYYSSSLDPDSPLYARGINFDSNGVVLSYISRCMGMPIRPVLAFQDESRVHGIELFNSSEFSLYEGEGVKLVPLVIPETALNKNVEWSSNAPGIVSVDADGKVMAKKGGIAVITATTVDGGFKTECTIIVKSTPVLEAVDLGLSVKWANFNIGANAPEVYGNHYAWGEINTKSSYSWNNYLWSNGTEYSLTKYNTNSSFGAVDNITSLDSDDDAARAILGEPWRIPTDAEWTELRNNCIWEWIVNNKYYYYGQMVTSKKNGNSIFLPAAGPWLVSYENEGGGQGGFYWSSSLNTNNPSEAWGISFYNRGVERQSFSRYRQQSIRPVCPKD